MIIKIENRNMKYVALVTVMLAALFTNAQSNKEAEKLLKDVRKNTESYKTQVIAFTNEIDAPTGKPEKPRSKRSSNGTAKIKDQRFRVEIDGMIFLNDGKKAYIVYPDEEEINDFKDDEGNMNVTPSSILAAYEKGYSYAMAGKETVKGKTIQYVRLKPKASAEVKEIIIGIDVAKQQLYSFQQMAQDGVNTTFTVTSYATNQTLNDDLFSTQSAQFKGFEIIEE